jgi:hypothetical protein
MVWQELGETAVANDLNLLCHMKKETGIYITVFCITGVLGLVVAAFLRQVPVYVMSFLFISAFSLLLDFMAMKQEAARAKREGTQASYVSTAHGPIVAFLLAIIVTLVAVGYQMREEGAKCRQNCTVSECPSPQDFYLT